MSRRRRVFRGRGRRSPRTVPRWTAQSAGLTINAGAVGVQTLVSGDDASLLGDLVEGELLVKRVVGHITVRPQGNVGGSAGIGIIKLSAAIAPVFGGFADLLAAQQLIDRDILRMMNMDWNANWLANGLQRREELDIRVMRRLKSDESLRLVVSNAAAGDQIIVTIDVRILIVIRM